MRLIDADAAKTAINIAAQWAKNAVELSYNRGINEAVRLIESMPTVDPMKHGHWISVELKRSYGTIDGIKCSVCGSERIKRYRIQPNYCDNCGAKMNEEDKS